MWSTIHEKRTKRTLGEKVQFTKLMGILGLLHITDLFTTLYAHQNGLLEGNTLLTQNPLSMTLGFNPIFITIKLIGLLIIIPLALKTYPKITEAEQTIFHWVFTTLTILAGIVATNNIIIVIINTQI